MSFLRLYWCGLFSYSFPPGNLFESFACAYAQDDNSSSNPEGAPSADVLLLGSAPLVGLLLGVELLAGLLRKSAPPTVLMFGGASPTGLLPG